MKEMVCNHHGFKDYRLTSWLSNMIFKLNEPDFMVYIEEYCNICGKYLGRLDPMQNEYDTVLPKLRDILNKVIYSPFDEVIKELGGKNGEN